MIIMEVFMFAECGCWRWCRDTSGYVSDECVNERLEVMNGVIVDDELQKKKNNGTATRVGGVSTIRNTITVHVRHVYS